MPFKPPLQRFRSGVTAAHNFALTHNIVLYIPGRPVVGAVSAGRLALIERLLMVSADIHLGLAKRKVAD